MDEDLLAEGLELPCEVANLLLPDISLDDLFDAEFGKPASSDESPDKLDNTPTAAGEVPFAPSWT
jgi:hypothetical protein